MQHTKDEDDEDECLFLLHLKLLQLSDVAFTLTDHLSHLVLMFLLLVLPLCLLPLVLLYGKLKTYKKCEELNSYLNS